MNINSDMRANIHWSTFMDRPIYLDRLIQKKSNGMIKVITGIRRCGKSYLLFNLFYDHLKSEGVADDHIITLAMDDIENKKYRTAEALYYYIKERIEDHDPYYVLLDEVQLVDGFEEVMNSLLHINNADVYVTGSNARFLSKDIITEFRGRGDQVRVYPLSFSEYWNGYWNKRVDPPASISLSDAWQEYMTFGGMPQLITMRNADSKSQYLKSLFEETYIKDIVDRNSIRDTADLEDLMNIVASDIGGLTNPKRIADTFMSVKKTNIHQQTIKKYLDCFEDAFLIVKANRYDVKGRKYINTPMKYYFTDAGLRNARLNFRQMEETHIMENIIFNELLIRGYNVDVGVVHYDRIDENKHRSQTSLEVDFVCNQGSNRVYIQSALSLPDKEKMDQEQNSLIRIKDSFRKIIIVKEGITRYNENGVLILNLFDFLLGIEKI